MLNLSLPHTTGRFITAQEAHKAADAVIKAQMAARAYIDGDGEDDFEASLYRAIGRGKHEVLHTIPTNTEAWGLDTAMYLKTLHELEKDGFEVEDGAEIVVISF